MAYIAEALDARKAIVDNTDKEDREKLLAGAMANCIAKLLNGEDAYDEWVKAEVCAGLLGYPVYDDLTNDFVYELKEKLEIYDEPEEEYTDPVDSLSDALTNGLKAFGDKLAEIGAALSQPDETMQEQVKQEVESMVQHCETTGYYGEGVPAQPYESVSHAPEGDGESHLSGSEDDSLHLEEIPIPNEETSETASNEQENDDTDDSEEEEKPSRSRYYEEKCYPGVPKDGKRHGSGEFNDKKEMPKFRIHTKRDNPLPIPEKREYKDINVGTVIALYNAGWKPAEIADHEKKDVKDVYYIVKAVKRGTFR